MSVTSVLVACYPPAVRARWEVDLRREVEHRGPRGWPVAVAGALGLWAHPTVWPGSNDQGRRRLVLTGLGAAVLAAAFLLLRSEPENLLARPLAVASSAAVLGLALGMLTLCPCPPRDLVALRAAARLAARLLVVPLSVLVGLVVLANSPAIVRVVQDPLAHPLVVGAYWLTLVSCAVQGFRAVVGVVRRGLVRPAGHRRAHLGLVLVVTGLVLLAVVNGVQALHRVEGFGLAVLLTTMAILTARNLVLDVRRRPTS